MAKKVPMRLRYLRVNPRDPAPRSASCAEELQALLACWRLSGVDAPACLISVSALAACTASSSKSASIHQLKPSVNYKLNQMFKLFHP